MTERTYLIYTGIQASVLIVAILNVPSEFMAFTVFLSAVVLVLNALAMLFRMLD